MNKKWINFKRKTLLKEEKNVNSLFFGVFVIEGFNGDGDNIFLLDLTKLSETLTYLSSHYKKELNNSNLEIKQLFYDDGKENNFINSFKSGFRDCIVGVISIIKTEENGNGECFGSYEVKMSAVSEEYQGKGYGKLLYGLAASHAYMNDNNPNVGICADRATTSPAAERVWLSINNNPSWENQIPDEEPNQEKTDKEEQPNNKKKDYFDGTFDNIKNERTTPKEDNCRLKKTKLSLDNSDHLNRSFNTYEFVKNYNEYTKNFDKVIENHNHVGKFFMMTNDLPFISKFFERIFNSFFTRLYGRNNQ
ncbi:GNAT family N-acetyltransferase [Candidatus Pacearchaeota archaeon]|nr:GNAT family N-acetyltransferase [Candidatus Pacearchaeota archaeon]